MTCSPHDEPYIIFFRELDSSGNMVGRGRVDGKSRLVAVGAALTGPGRRDNRSTLEVVRLLTHASRLLSLPGTLVPVQVDLGACIVVKQRAWVTGDGHWFNGDELTRYGGVENVPS